MRFIMDEQLRQKYNDAVEKSYSQQEYLDGLIFAFNMLMCAAVVFEPNMFKYSTIASLIALIFLAWSFISAVHCRRKIIFHILENSDSDYDEVKKSVNQIISKEDPLTRFNNKITLAFSAVSALLFAIAII